MVKIRKGTPLMVLLLTTIRGGIETTTIPLISHLVLGILTPVAGQNSVTLPPTGALTGSLPAPPGMEPAVSGTGNGTFMST